MAHVMCDLKVIFQFTKKTAQNSPVSPSFNACRGEHTHDNQNIIMSQFEAI